jgi:hypothetical protein
MADIDSMRVFRRLLDAAVRFEAKAARHARLETERRALQEAITQTQLVLSVGHKPMKAPTTEAKSAGEDVMETGVLLRALPGGKAIRAEERKMPKNKMRRRKAKVRTSNLEGER